MGNLHEEKEVTSEKSSRIWGSFKQASELPKRLNPLWHPHYFLHQSTLHFFWVAWCKSSQSTLTSSDSWDPMAFSENDAQSGAEGFQLNTRLRRAAKCGRGKVWGCEAVRLWGLTRKSENHWRFGGFQLVMGVPSSRWFIMEHPIEI